MIFQYDRYFYSEVKRVTATDKTEKHEKMEVTPQFKPPRENILFIT